MNYAVTQTDVNLLKQQVKQYFIRLELLNRSMTVIDGLEGEVLDGNITIDANSDIRRICNFNLFVKDKSYYVEEQAKIWIDKFVRVYIGTLDIYRKSTIWYPLGIFLFNDNSFEYTATTRTLSISCVDFMATFTGLRNGVIDGMKTVIPTGSSIRNSIISTITQLGGITNYVVDEDPDVSRRLVPFDLEFGPGVTIHEMLVKLRDLYPGWEMFFDVYGNFIYQKMPTLANDTEVLNDEILSNSIVISDGLTNSFSQIKNVVQVWGRDGTTYNANDISATVKLVDRIPSPPESGVFYLVNSQSPFTTNKIGEILMVKSGGEYEKIYNIELCRQRGNYELWLSANMNDTISLETILIPWLDVNQKFSYTSHNKSTTEQYITKRLNFNFGDGKMVMEAIRFYSLYPSII